MSTTSRFDTFCRPVVIASTVGAALLALLVVLSAAAQSASYSEAIIYIGGPDEIVYAGEEITVTVGISDVVDLDRLEMTVIFDPAVLQVIDADTGTEGIQITPGECPVVDFMPLNVSDNTLGTIMYWVDQNDPTPPVTGNCHIAYIRFSTHQITSTVVNVSELLLETESGVPIPYTTKELELNLLQPTPVADFVGNPTSGIAPLMVNFANQSTGIYTTCIWDFGDGSFSSSCLNPFKTYTNSGVYTISLSVSGPYGTDTRTRNEYISVYEPVSADFSGFPISGPRPLNVDFTNLSSGDFDNCDWQFGDGDSSIICSAPSHRYASSGVYSVSLSVNGFGGIDSITASNYISVYVPVTASFSAVPTSGIAPILVEFTNSSTGDFDTCSWAFGDGGASSDCSDPDHSFTSGGSYTVSLTASGPGGISTLTKTNCITVYEPVVAGFSGLPTSGIAPLQVDFANNSSGDFESCFWEFGDGDSSGDCINSSHVYSSNGVFTVSLTISGSGGIDDVSETNYITVYEPVIAAFSGTPTNGTAPFWVQFTNESAGDFDSCNWDFGDGGESSDCVDTSHDYIDPGIYGVTLVVTGPGGVDSEIKNQYITVNTIYCTFLPIAQSLP
jgi:PKD repeat protein